MKKIFVSMLVGLVLMTNLVGSAFAANNGAITRADFAVMVVKRLPEIDRAVLNQAGDCYDDIDGLRQEKFICYLVEDGVLSGDGGEFRPNSTVTRAEAAAILTEAFDLVDANPDLASLYSDVENQAWYKGYFNTLAVYGIPEPEIILCEEIDPAGTLTHAVARAWTLRIRNAEASQMEACRGVEVLNVSKSISLKVPVIGGTNSVELAKFKFSAADGNIFMQEFAMNLGYDDNDMPLNNLVLKNRQGEVVAGPVAVGIDRIVFDMNDLEIQENNGEILKLYADVPVIYTNVEVSVSINEEDIVAENEDGDIVGIGGHFPMEMNFSLLKSVNW